ncbi:MAG: hypothetical protein KDI71_24200 [Xanthomonadales bacterium]|nr:hypothetical protein [Xanthomonadales bacterium]
MGRVLHFPVSTRRSRIGVSLSDPLLNSYVLHALHQGLPEARILDINDLDARPASLDLLICEALPAAWQGDCAVLCLGPLAASQEPRQLDHRLWLMAVPYTRDRLIQAVQTIHQCGCDP